MRSAPSDSPTRLAARADPQPLEQFAVHGVYSLELFRRERPAPLDAAHRELDQAVGDDVGDVLEIDHRRQDVLAPGTLALVVEGLLAAHVGETAANRDSQLIDAPVLRSHRLGACAIVMLADLERIAQHALD